MRRIGFAVVSLVMFFVCIVSAQQTNTTAQASNCSGKNGFVPVFMGTNNALCNSGIFEASPLGSGPIGILNHHPVAALDVTGNINSSANYQIGESTVLSIGNPNDGNLFVGPQSGTNNSSGNGNTFVGLGAGNANTTGSGSTFLGNQAGSVNAGGQQNTFLGTFAGSNNTTGSANTFIGIEAGINNVSGGNDIYIGSLGGASNAESNTVRIGDTQSAAYMAGVFGATLGSGVAVYVNSDGQLGMQPSSARFKQDVRDMGEGTDGLMDLHPVTFSYKPQFDTAGARQYGLIAEEVARVYPELVVNDAQGRPYAVRYQYLPSMLLNEVQKQYRRAEAEAEVVSAQERKMADQQQQIEELQRRLARVEALVSGR